MNAPVARGLKLALRLLGRRLLATWLCLLRHGAETRSGELAGNAVTEAFLRRNQVLQEELRQIFAPYHRFCPECGSSCCREPAIPFSRLDVILYGGLELPQGSGKAECGESRLYWECFCADYLRRKLRQFSRPEATPAGGEQSGAGAYCPALKASGCSLPWGRRPVICVFCACPQFLAEMGWQEFGRYVWVNAKYLGHLSLLLKATRS
jgi:hypothetical protein